MLRKALLAVASVGLFCGVSSAATLFDFSGANATGTSLVFNNGGIQLTVTAVDSNGNPGATVNRDATVGLGVVGDTSNLTVDGPSERLFFGFIPNITLNSVTFDNFQTGSGQSGDAGQIVVKLVNNSNQTVFSGLLPVGGFVDLTGLPVIDRTGATVVIGFDPQGRGNDNFSVLNLSVASQTLPPTSVPLPAGVWAGASLLSALGLKRKFRKNRA